MNATYMNVHILVMLLLRPSPPLVVFFSCFPVVVVGVGNVLCRRRIENAVLLYFCLSDWRD